MNKHKIELVFTNNTENKNGNMKRKMRNKGFDKKEWRWGLHCKQIIQFIWQIEDLLHLEVKRNYRRKNKLS